MSSPLEQLALIGAPLSDVVRNHDILRKIETPHIANQITINRQYLFDDTVFEAEEDEREVLDSRYFANFIAKCKENHVEYQQVLRDLGVVLPAHIFSDACLKEYVEQMHIE